MSLIAVCASLASNAQAECVSADVATPQSVCVVGVPRGSARGVWTSLGEFDRLTREVAAGLEYGRQAELLRKANAERQAQVAAMQLALTEQRQATVAASERADAEAVRAAQAEDDAQTERARAAAWDRSPIVGAVIGAGLVVLGAVAIGATK